MSDNALMLRPVPIEDAMITAMDATESVAPYNPATAYAIGDEARSDTTHRVYRSAIGANTGNDPTLAANRPAKWVDVRPTNDRAMFDALKSTRTVFSGATGSWTIEPGKPVNCTGLAQLSGTQLDVSMPLGGGEFYTYSKSLIDTSGIVDWYTWTIDERPQEDTVFIPDLPIVANPVITYTLTGSDPGCGVCQVGKQLDIGLALVGANADFTSYSEYTQDGYGGVDVTARGYSFNEEVPLRLPTDPPGWPKYIRREVLKWRDTPVFFALAGDFTLLTGFGFAKQFHIEIQYPVQGYALATLRVEETLETS